MNLEDYFAMLQKMAAQDKRRRECLEHNDGIDPPSSPPNNQRF